MADGSGELEVDPVFLGLTRPPMFLGVSYTWVLMEFFIFLMIFILTSDLKILFLALPAAHGVGYIATAKEPLFIELFMIKQSKCNRCKNRMYHGFTNSYDIS